MELLDIILLIPIIWFTIKGFLKGLIIEIATFGALLLGIYTAYFFSNITASFLFEKFSFNTPYLQSIAFVITFAIVVILVFLFAKTIEALVKTIKLGFVNKLAGAVIGFLKISIILGLILYQISFFDFNEKLISAQTKEKSYVYKPLIAISTSALPLIKNIKAKLLACKNKNATHD